MGYAEHGSAPSGYKRRGKVVRTTKQVPRHLADLSPSSEVEALERFAVALFPRRAAWPESCRPGRRREACGAATADQDGQQADFLPLPMLRRLLSMLPATARHFS